MHRRWLVIAILASVACTRLPAARTPPSDVVRPPPSPLHPRLSFFAESDPFSTARDEYERIWAADGERIVRAMESISGLTFRDTAVTVVVYEGISRSGYRESPMLMRASYPTDTKKATLVHELGHRLQSGLFKRDEEEHGPLFLWLYDTWIELYGRVFADTQVEVEKRRRGPYPKAWDDALALTPSERAQRWRAILAERLPTRR